MRKMVIDILMILCVSMAGSMFAQPTPEIMYNELQTNLATGWNTWDTRSVLTHVFLPYGFAIDLNLMDSEGHRVNQFKIGSRANDAPTLKPYAHTYDGTYTKINVKWHGYDLMVESAAEGDTNIILITPQNDCKRGTAVVAPKSLWGRGNIIERKDTDFILAPKDKSVIIETKILGKCVKLDKGSYSVSLDEPIAICCNKNLSLREARRIVNERGKQFVMQNRKKYGDNYDCYNAMQTILGWNNIYDPGIRKVITPVSRIWSSEWFASVDFGGFTLFCWDTYFASMMLGVGNKELAYANAVEITKAITEDGFVPNCYYSNGFKSRDRSQPPVGSLAVWTLYSQYKEKWFLELLYNELLSWNNWWIKNRQDQDLLCLGSSPYEKVTYFRSEYDQNNRYASNLESGLDNSPMFDEVQFNTDKHLMEQQDVGISSLYIMDCEYLSRIATELGKNEDAILLANRAAHFRNKLSLLWDEKNGFYYNRSTRDGSLNYRTSPTCFYPLLGKAPTGQQAKRMIEEHLLNQKEYWGEYIIPATPKNDAAYKDNEYWRGRIWAPLNFLVYMGVRNYDFPKVQKAISDKSKKLLLKSWLKDGYVFENYNSETGIGDDTQRSDKFYHWGALLGYISLIENGVVKID